MNLNREYKDIAEVFIRTMNEYKNDEIEIFGYSDELMQRLDEETDHLTKEWNRLIDKHNEKIRAEVIDEYKDKLCSTLEEYQTGFNMVSMANVWHFSDEIAGQLKENKNEIDRRRCI